MSGYQSNYLSSALWRLPETVSAGLISQLGVVDDAFPPEAVRLASFGVFKLERFIKQSGIMSGRLCGAYARRQWQIEGDLLLLQDTLTQLTKVLPAWGIRGERAGNDSATVAATLATEVQESSILGRQTIRAVASQILKLSEQAGKKRLYSMTGDRAEVIHHLRCLDIILDGLLDGVDTARASSRFEAWEVGVLEDETAQRLQKILG